MILGIDVGTGVTKGALVEGGEFLWGARRSTMANPESAIRAILEALSHEIGITKDRLADVVVTGWGQDKVHGWKTDETVASIARAAVWDVPSCRTVLCMGAQESLALSLNDRGRVTGYCRNDKCASGAGRFLEIICEALDCEVENTATIAASSDKKLQMSTQCAVFAESEVVSLVNDGESVANIAEGILSALAASAATLCKKINKKDAFIVSGGLANNTRIYQLLQDSLRMELHVFRPQADYIAAVGAALSANGEAK